ncbi:hypothetical protein C8R48DRAFT_678613 [Suillus tomentosus]|nr:hypothetical protein C8R48DRAFT_678613 [Suillus tomentosus]
MHSKAGTEPRTPGPPSRKHLRQCIHVGSNVTLKLEDSDIENSEMGTDCTGMQTTGEIEDGQPMIEVESELRQVKEQLRDAKNNIAYLSDRVLTYRYRWLEEYYCTENLDHHMPQDICVPDLPQVTYGAPSPSISSDILKWDEADAGSEQTERSEGEHPAIPNSIHVNSDE